MFSRRVPPLDEPNAWSARLAALRAAGRPVADLAESNPTRVGLSPLAEAAAALARVPPMPYAPDPRGLPAARRAVAGALRGDGDAVAPEDVVLTASTSESYGLLFKLFCEPGECVLVPVPGYPLFEPLARAEGLHAVPYPLRFDGRWHLDRAALAAAAPGARVIVTVEPNPPIGACLDADDRAFLEQVALEHDLAIVADEVFRGSPWPPHERLPGWLGARAALTCVLGGLSKRCGLPHLKLGWIALAGPPATRAAALARLEWLADLALSVGSPVQHALPELLALHGTFAPRVRGRLLANLAALDALAAAHPECTRLPADGGWNAVLRVPAVRSDEAWALRLLERGVALHPGHFYDLEGGAHLVVSLIVEPEVFALGLGALAAELAAG